MSLTLRISRPPRMLTIPGVEDHVFTLEELRSMYVFCYHNTYREFVTLPGYYLAGKIGNRFIAFTTEFRGINVDVAINPLYKEAHSSSPELYDISSSEQLVPERGHITLKLSEKVLENPLFDEILKEHRYLTGEELISAMLFWFRYEMFMDSLHSDEDHYYIGVIGCGNMKFKVSLSRFFEFEHEYVGEETSTSSS